MASAAAERIRAELFPTRATVPLSISEIRAEQEVITRKVDQTPAGISLTRCKVGDLWSEWIRASSADPTGTILYLHGGGFVAGCSAAYRNMTSQLAVSSNSSVLVPEYRLAPEHPFPASVEDSIAVYHELIHEGIDPRKLVVMGDSAGGGLCAALLLALRDARSQMPAAAVLISPWTDLTLSGETCRTRASRDPIDRLPVLRQMVELYLGGSDPGAPLASPVFGDLRGLPKTLIQVGDDEVLLSDSTRFFERAKEAGVQVQIEVWPEMWHGWHMSAPALPEANEAIRRIGAFVRDVTLE